MTPAGQEASYVASVLFPFDFHTARPSRPGMGRAVARHTKRPKCGYKAHEF